MIIFPTHRCFDDALEFCEDAARAGRKGWRRLLLVHGIILVPEDQPPSADGRPGDRAVHAWVEDGDLCWDAGLLEDGRRIVYAAARDEFHRHWRVQEMTRYTMRAALAENKRSGTYGPWRPDYIALCGKALRASRSLLEVL